MLPTNAGYIISFFVCALQRLGQALEHLDQPPGLLARAHQAHEHLAEHLGVVVERLRDALAAFDRLDQARGHFAKPRILGAVAQVGETLDDRHTGRR
jgi:hypothetical protein